MANITKVYLLNTPLEKDYNHTLYFADKSSQQAYFQSRLVKSFTDFSYQRKDNVIRVPDSYDNLIQCNYVMYQNTAQSNKWYYAFITDMKYVNDGMTEVHIETDVIQTWLFDYRIRESFIEREHVADDDIGVNTIEEGLQLGEYICKQHARAGYGGSSLKIVVGVTEDKEGNAFAGGMYTGMYSGIKYYAFNNDGVGILGIDTLLKEYDSDAKAEAVKCMFLAPSTMITMSSDHAVVQTDYTDKHYINMGTRPGEESIINKEIEFTDTLDGYTPKNNKLLTYPFRYILVTNNNGGSAVYHHEQFYMKNQSIIGEKMMLSPIFRIQGCLTPGCSVRIVPVNYKGIAENDEEGLNLGKYPILNWTSDYFTNWLTQNGVNIGVSALASAGTIIGGIAAMGTVAGGVAGAGMIASGVSGIISTLSEVRKAALVPNQSSGNLNCGDVITASGTNDFHFYEMTIKEEYAKILDGFFNCYGYKVNRFGIPYLVHRENYWYTKTVDVNIDGALPQTDLQKIKDCYNKGITFWQNAENIGDYSVSNAITV